MDCGYHSTETCSCLCSLLLARPFAGSVKVSASSGPAPTPAATSQSSTLSTDAQLKSLLKIKTSIDKAQVLREWTREGGVNGAYCNWRGVHCIPGTSTIHKIHFDHKTKGFANYANYLAGTLPPAAAFDGLGGLTNITFTGYASHGIQGPLPADWSTLTRLQSIDLILDAFKGIGSIPASWGSLKQLKRLDIWAAFKGPIPASFASLTSLEELAIIGSITGPIPDLSPLTNLRELALHGDFGGPIPTWLPKLKKLEVLDLYDGGFTGSIPASIATLGKLRELNLAYGGINRWAPLKSSDQYSQLSGTLPDAFKALTALQELDLSDQDLVGTVPASWSGMTSLKEVHLFGNGKLEGCLPASWKAQLTGLLREGDNRTWTYADVKKQAMQWTKIQGYC
jgi:hypothetical protein